MMRLERLREIVRSDRHQGPEPQAAPAPAGRDEATARCLGGTVETGPGGSSLVVRRAYPRTERYGRHALGAYPPVTAQGLDALTAGSGETGLAPGSVVCYDLETTGLSGGAGTLAFLVGLGWFDDDAFHTQQHLLVSPTQESRLLDAVTQVLEQAHTVVTFNGRSFDGPLTETRYALHRLPSPFHTRRHVDLLPPARHLWRDDECRLVRLERDVLGMHRVGDLPSGEIPSRYVSYLRSGDARPLSTVLEHNRLDLVSLGVLTGLACHLLHGGLAVATGARQAFGLGRLYEKTGDVDRAVECYRGAAGLGRAIPVRRMRAPRVGADVTTHALARLARLYRRQRRYAEAAQAWARLLARRDASSLLRREARVALAIHHEHRLRDPSTARQLALEALRVEEHPKRRREVEHRLTRLEAKLEARRPPGLWR